MSYGVLVQAEYEDGFILTEDEADQSPYDEGRNIFHAILNGKPELEHGRMVRWSAITEKFTYSIDWKTVCWGKENPRPISYRKMERTRAVDGSSDTGPICVGHFFGYQWNNPDGSKEQDIQEVEI
jgi:hypothetical protein